MSQPHLKVVKFERPNRRGNVKYAWTEHQCSECSRTLHDTARFCVECGA